MATLEELKKRLYGPGEVFAERTSPPNIVQKGLAEKKISNEPEKPFAKINLNKVMSSKIFWLTAGAIIIIVFYAFFSSIFNFQNIDLKIEGQKEIKSGEKILFKVTVTNKSKKDVEDTSLVFGISDIFKDRVNIGAIKSGESVEREFETTIFGGRGKNFEAKSLLEYKPKGSSSFFVEEKFFQFIIAQSPITVSFSMPDEIRFGEDIKFKISYFSQSDVILPNLFLKIDYPSGFKYKDSDTKPTEGNNIWKIGDIEPGKEGYINVSGVINGGISGVSNFVASIGSKNGKDLLILDETSKALALRLPYLEVEILPKGEKEKYTASIGEEIPFLIGWKNNLPEIIEDASLEVVLDGEAWDLSSVMVRNGFFISKDKKVIWNPSSYKDFSSISPGKSDFLGFSAKVKKNISLNVVGKNPVLKVKASFMPGKSVPGFEDVNVSGEDEIEIPISSSVQFSQKGFYFDSSIENFGPLPPKVDKETAYTIVWSLANPLNDTKNLVVKAVLPPYASFKNVFVPSSANVVFDKNTGVLEWRVGTLEAGTGFIRPAISLSFQVGIVPSLTQIGTSPQIISTGEAFGTDSFTEKNLFSSQSEITTDLRDDSRIDFSQKNVVK